MNKKTSVLQAAIKRKQVAQGKDDFPTQKQAALDLQAVLKRKKIAGRFPRVLEKYRELEDKAQQQRAASTLQGAIKRKQVEQVQQAERAAERRQAASTLQAVLRQKQVEQADRDFSSQKQAALDLQAILKRKKIAGRFPRVLEKYRELEDKAKQQRAALTLQSAAKRAIIQPDYNEVLDEIKQDVDAANRINAAAQAKIQRDRYKKGIQRVRNYNKLKTTQKRIAFDKFASASEQPQRAAVNLYQLANKAAAEKRKVERNIQASESMRQQRIANALGKLAKDKLKLDLMKRGQAASSRAEAEALMEMEPLGLPSRLGDEQEALARIRAARARALLPQLPPEEESALSALSTSPQQEAGRQRRERSDKGKKRGPYSKQPAGRALELSPPRAAARARSQGRAAERDPDETPPQRRTRSQTRAARQATSRTRSQTKEFRTGQGIRKIIKRKPVSLNKEEKMKNRLRLVASQIEAGNTNPKLVVEVNDLYKKLYNIDNAIMLLKRK